ncbi:MAG: thiazole synthase [SAR324 cluster bacterium]|nr:thiazole synthase [SAR324 cluster bacterium]
MEQLTIGGKTFGSRLFLGTGKFSSNQMMKESIVASGSELVTLALKRFDAENASDEMLESVQLKGVGILPNTSGVRTAKEAIFASELAREALETNWLKLEIHPDPRYLLPDHRETLIACEALAKKGFIVLPYINADPVFCKQLEEAGASAVMPLAAPIGSNRGLVTREMLEIIIAESKLPVVIDAGLGAPSHAAEAMEMGADACLVNTAIAVSGDPVKMALAFKIAVQAGRLAFEAGLGGSIKKGAEASSPLTAFLSE